MIIDKTHLYRFEKGLNPQKIELSEIPAAIIGFGEISAIFKIQALSDWIFKRLPLFKNTAGAKSYEQMYHQYCRFLTLAGLTLPDHDTYITATAGRPVSLYIAQKEFSGRSFCHRLIHTLNHESSLMMIEQVVREIARVWDYNQQAGQTVELAIDGQLSNWVFLEESTGNKLLYIDTSTPLYRINGIEQQDPELMLQSAPGFLRWIIRWLFLDDVLNRYYDPRLVYIDLAANLYKEQKPELVSPVIEIINRFLPGNGSLITREEVDKYYREDKIIWTVFLSFRKLDRFITTALLGKRYEFILPGKIIR